MDEAPLRPLPGRALLELRSATPRGGRFLIGADLHLGLGSFRPGQPAPPGVTAGSFAEGLLEAGRTARATGFILAGDTKHPIVGTPPALRRELFGFFSTLLASGYTVEVILGNHDVDLARHLPKEVAMHPAAGLVRFGVGIFHGHAWPSAAVLRARTLVAGHLHPGFRFAATPKSPGGKERCWLRVEYPAPGLVASPRGRRPAEPGARALVVLPALNPLTGTEALNREAPARIRTFLYRRFVQPGAARAYLLDGTDLGPILTSPASPRPSGSSPGGS